MLEEGLLPASQALDTNIVGWAMTFPERISNYRILGLFAYLLAHTLCTLFLWLPLQNSMWQDIKVSRYMNIFLPVSAIQSSLPVRLQMMNNLKTVPL